MQEITISNYFLQATLRNISQEESHRLLKLANIPMSIFSKHHARITAEQYAHLQKLVMLSLKDEMLGYFEQAIKLGTWDVTCHWVINTKTLSAALKRFCHFCQIIEHGLKIELSIKEEIILIKLIPRETNTTLPLFTYEFFAFNLHRLACWLIQKNIPINNVCIPFSQPLHYLEYRSMFPRTQVTYDTSEFSLEFDKSFLQERIVQSPETLSVFLKNSLLNIIINDYDQNSWTSKTRSVLIDCIANTPTLVDVAKKLFLHPKKLRKLLEKEGITYVEVKNQLRRDLSIRYLTGTDKSIEDIADITGFSETSSFTRAFKTWTEVTPYTYRKNKLKHL